MRLATGHRHESNMEFLVAENGVEPLTDEERDLIVRFESEKVDRQHSGFLSDFNLANATSPTRHGMYVSYAKTHSAAEVRTKIIFDLEMATAMAQRVTGEIFRFCDYNEGRVDGIPARAAAYYYDQEFHRARGTYIACRSAAQRYILQDDPEMANLLEDWA